MKRLVLLAFVACAAPPANHPDVVTPTPVAGTSPLPAGTTPNVPPRDPRGAVRLLFEGNVEVPTAELLKVTRVDKPEANGESPAQDLYERDILLLTSEYYDRGFVTVEVAPSRIVESKTWPFHEAHVVIKEGPRFHLRGLSVVEHDANGIEVTTLGGGKARLRDRFRCADGDWFSRKLMMTGITAINHLYRDAAFGNVEVDPQTRLDTEHALIDVDVEIRRGSPVTVDRVVIDGNTTVKADAIERELLVKPRQPYSETKLEESKKRLFATGLFERVDVSTSATPSANHWTVTFEVVEKSK